MYQARQLLLCIAKLCHRQILPNPYPESPMKRLTLLTVALLAATSAQAQTTLLSDSFDTENGGNSASNFTGFANWNVTGGTVDIIRGGTNGIFCFGGGGSCVDIDGSSSQGGTLTTKTAFSFSAGERVVITFMASGSQRTTASDLLQLNLNFSTPTTFASYAANLAGVISGGGPTAVGNTFSTGRNLPGDTAFGMWSFEFLASNAGTFTFALSTTSADNIGPVIDDVRIVRFDGTNPSVVPEPSTYALMITGLTLLGAAARRKRNAA